ncbi:hypothetical protein BJY04DRAFT_224373 [Aspergillus karnatakaensis]|uniref:uncharacterized protein n=1 Tax=Aspergillus karnatakaensis TaxID=1810916 RepID=UPI003CCCB595
MVSSYGNDANGMASQWNNSPIIGTDMQHNFHNYGVVMNFTSSPRDAAESNEELKKSIYHKILQMESMWPHPAQSWANYILSPSHYAHEGGDYQPPSWVTGMQNIPREAQVSRTRPTVGQTEEYHLWTTQLKLANTLISSIDIHKYMKHDGRSDKVVQCCREIHEYWLKSDEIHTLCHDIAMVETIKDQVLDHFLPCPQAAIDSAQEVSRALNRSKTEGTLQKKHRPSGELRRSKRVAKRSSSATSLSSSSSPSFTSRVAKRQRQVTCWKVAKGLEETLRDLRDKTDILSRACRRIIQRNKQLPNLRSAQFTYRTLYHFLHSKCKQHETHILDLDLEAGVETNGFIAVKFRLALPTAQGIRSTESEALWTFKAREEHHFSSNDPGPQTKQALGCPLSLITNKLTPATLASNPDKAIPPMPYVHQGTRWTCEYSGSQKRNSRTLTEINKWLRKQFIAREVEILRLAKQISTIVMRFNYPLGLCPFWNCDNVRLFFDDPLAEPSFRHEPYFRIHLRRGSYDLQASDSGSWAYNAQSMLFCLGIVLYELWRHFPRDRDAYEPIIGELELEERLGVKAKIIAQMEAWVALGKMPETYMDIIMWCLNISSYTVEDMTQSMKKGEMYDTVICGLDEVERQYAIPTADMYDCRRRSHRR